MLFDFVMINDYVGGDLNATKKMKDAVSFLKCVGNNERNTTFEKKERIHKMFIYVNSFKICPLKPLSLYNTQYTHVSFDDRRDNAEAMTRTINIRCFKII